MESEKPHRRRVSTSDFFLCFSSRSSMKIPSSRSMPSPGRSRGEPSLSLSSSLSRRLRSNGSMKGGQGQASPMFPTGSKKKGGNGGAFEPAEPTSPKVTCIGQVRVKTKKKHGRKMRTRSKRRGGGSGEVSFRKGEDGEGLKGRNQRWVHLPLTICEALRGLGACGGKSGCSWGKVEKRKTRSSTSSGSCGAGFTRCFFTVDEKREIVRGEERLEEEEEDRRREMRERFREIEVEILEEREEMQEVIEGEDDDEEARVSICIPPKNALLLMRCRSEPFRNSSLANRFWESPAPNVVDDDEDEDNEEEEVEDIDEEVVAEVGIVENEEKTEQLEEKKEDEDVMESEEAKNPLEEETPEAQEVKNPSVEETPEAEMPEKSETEDEKTEEQEPLAVEEDIMLNRPSISTREALVGEDKRDEEEEPKIQENEEENARVSTSSPTLSVQQEEEEEEEEEEQSEAEQEQLETVEEEAAALFEKSTEEQTLVPVPEVKQQVRQANRQDEERETASSSSPDGLPDCLLLMMCEPKLSMEVSKETWVCSTDFISFRHHHPEKKSNAGDETKKRLSTDTRPTPRAQQRQSPVRPAQKPKHHRQKQKQKIQIQPARSSISGPTMANMIEQKLVNAAAYEPFVLTRCKSEPVRSSSKLAPEACFWKSRKVEPHRTPGLEVGATGIGV